MSDWIDQSDGNINTDINAPPYDDNKMTFDTKRKMYILLETALTRETGVDLRKRVNTGIGEASILTDYYLKQISAKVYRYIYDRTYDKARTEYVLAVSPAARAMLYDCLIQQAVYFVINGDTSQFAGVNVRTGQVIERKSLILSAVSPDVENILLNTPIPELGGRSVIDLSIC